VLAEAQALQGIVARADRTIAVTGIAGTKYLLRRLYGYGGVPRRPLRGLAEGDETGERLWGHEHVVELVRVERELSGANAGTR
jgi:4-hydroxy-2-oxoglutarate aldolase